MGESSKLQNFGLQAKRPIVVDDIDVEEHMGESSKLQNFGLQAKRPIVVDDIDVEEHMGESSKLQNFGLQAKRPIVVDDIDVEEHMGESSKLQNFGLQAKRPIVVDDIDVEEHMGESSKLQNFGLQAKRPIVVDDIDVEEHLDNVVLTELNKIIGHVDVSKNVSHIREQISDAEKLLGHTSSLMTCIKESMQSERIRISPVDFVMGILRGFDMNVITLGVKEQDYGTQNKVPNICWTALGEKGNQIFRDVHSGCSTLIGSLEIKMNPGRRKSNYACKDILVETWPLEIITNDAAEDDSLEMKVGSLYGKLLENKLLVLEKLLFEDSSFSHAVENLFALSFLVRDGCAELTISKNGEHWIVPRIAPTTEDRSRGIHNTQFVFRIDYSEWKMQKQQQERLEPPKTRLLLDLNSESNNDSRYERQYLSNLGNGESSMVAVLPPEDGIGYFDPDKNSTAEQ